jgi:glyoxylase-like metal-dependent hydrolase (beta-lactamase superfamily II)
MGMGGHVFIEQFRTGGDRNFGYLVADEETSKAAIIDASYAPERIVEKAREEGYEIEYVFSTHDHFDHTNGNQTVERMTGKRALLFGDTDPETGITIEDSAALPLGELEITIIHTPGHTSDAMCVYVGDAVFTGDTLFVGKVGGTDLGSGARAEYESLHQKLMTLPDDTRVYPGHDVGVAPVSTIAHEQETNPFLLQPDFEAFVDLKRNWADYKKEHGIT